MKIEIKATSDGIGYASKSPYEYDGKHFEADIQDGDLVTIKDAGTVETGGKFGDQYYFKIDTRNGVKKAAFNQSSLNILAQEWGQESEEWVGRQIRILTRKSMIAGERRVVAYYVTDGWTIDEWGDLTKAVDVNQPPVKPTFTPKTEAQADVEYIRNQEINPEDIPFKD